jgi:hypothetical protein
MMAGKLSPEGEITAAHGAAMVAAFQVLINCLEENVLLLPGQFPDALTDYIQMVKSRKGDLAIKPLRCCTTFGRPRIISCFRQPHRFSASLKSARRTKTPGAEMKEAADEARRAGRR